MNADLTENTVDEFEAYNAQIPGGDVLQIGRWTQNAQKTGFYRPLLVDMNDGFHPAYAFRGNNDTDSLGTVTVSKHSYTDHDTADRLQSTFANEGDRGLRDAGKEMAAQQTDETIVWQGRWQFEDSGTTEAREIVVRTDAGFHPGVERSHMGGDGGYGFSDQAFSTMARAKHFADVYAYDSGGLKVAVEEFEAAAQKIGHLIDAPAQTVGVRTVLDATLREVGSSAAQVTRGETASLAALTEDPAQVSRIVDTVTATSDRVMYDLVRDEVRRAGLDDSDANAIDGFIAATYGSEEAYIQQTNTRFQLADFRSAGISLIAGRQSEIPSMTDEQAARFRSDFDGVYGDGAYEQFRAGDTHVIAKDYPTAQGRQAILRGVQEHEGDLANLSEADRQDRDDAFRLARRIQRADWHYNYSDDSSVRSRGAFETHEVRQDAAEFASRSSYHAEWVSAAWDASEASGTSSAFKGYVPATDRVAVSNFDRFDTQQNAAAGQDKELDAEAKSKNLADIEADSASMMMKLVKDTAENLTFIRENLSQLPPEHQASVGEVFTRVIKDAAGHYGIEMLSGDRSVTITGKGSDLDMDL